MEALVRQQEGEMAALEATLEAEETRHTAEISKKLDEEHKENVQQAYRALLEKVRFLFARSLLSSCKSWFTCFNFPKCMCKCAKLSAHEGKLFSNRPQSNTGVVLK